MGYTIKWWTLQSSKRG